MMLLSLYEACPCREHIEYSFLDCFCLPSPNCALKWTELLERLAAHASLPYIYGCLIMIVAVIAESMIIIYVHCDLESHGGGALLVFGDRL